MDSQRLKIFQYDAKNEIVPSFSPDDTNEDKTRWIAAIDDIAADDYANEQGWTLLPGEILSKHNYITKEDYVAAGVDVILFPTMFENHYACPQCSEEWNDVWSCSCDDECPNCGQRDISPVESIALTS